MPHLVPPSTQYQASYLSALDEYLAEKPVAAHYTTLDPDRIRKNFQEYVAGLLDEANGVGLPPGHVPHTEFWLVEGDEFLGRLDIRHELNDYLHHAGGHIGYDLRPSARGKGYGKLILKLGLEKAKELGIENALVTCDLNNLPSKKVIEANGGVLEDVRAMGSGQADKARYWIDTTKPVL